MHVAKPRFGHRDGIAAIWRYTPRLCASTFAIALSWPYAALAAPSATVSHSVLVPAGTAVVVSLAEPVSSATASVNDQVAVVVKKPVLVNGWIVVPAGSNGHATVTAVERAASNGSGGKLSMSVDWVHSSDGGMIQLSTTHHASESGDSKGAASTATLLSSVFLGPVGFFAHNLVRGREVTIGTDRTFTVFADHAVRVRATQQATQSHVFDQ
jgi:hypothetical protein